MKRAFNIHFRLDPEGVLANGEPIDHTLYSSDRRGPSLPGQERVFRRDMVRRSLKQMGLHLPRGAELGTEWTEPVEEQLIGWFNGDFADEVDEFDTERHNYWTIDINGVDVPVQPGDMIETVRGAETVRYRGQLYREAAPAKLHKPEVGGDYYPRCSNYVAAALGICISRKISGMFEFFPALRAHGWDFEIVEQEGGTVRRFVKEHPEGVWALNTSGHVIFIGMRVNKADRSLLLALLCLNSISYLLNIHVSQP